MNNVLSGTNFRYYFIGLVALDLVIGSSATFSEYRMVTKPLILFSLLIYFALRGKHLSKPTYYLMLVALVYSLCGDVLLLFENVSPNYFIAGLISFLLAHIFYTLVFLKKWQKRTPQFFIPVTILLIGYGCTLYYFLKDELGDLTIPVIVYILGILMMAITALRRSEKTGATSYFLVLTGAFCFLASDSILAVNKFMFELPGTHVLVMSTYAAAQYMIVEGILKQRIARTI